MSISYRQISCWAVKPPCEHFTVSFTCSNILKPSHPSFIFHLSLSLSLYSSLCATEWCDSREQTMSGYPGNLGRRTEVSWAGGVPSTRCGSSPTDDSPASTMKVNDPNLSKAGGGGAGEEGRWGRGIIRRRGWRCLRQWHLLIGRCPCPWHK